MSFPLNPIPGVTTHTTDDGRVLIFRSNPNRWDPLISGGVVDEEAIRQIVKEELLEALQDIPDKQWVQDQIQQSTGGAGGLGDAPSHAGVFYGRRNYWWKPSMIVGPPSSSNPNVPASAAAQDAVDGTLWLDTEHVPDIPAPPLPPGGIVHSANFVTETFSGGSFSAFATASGFSLTRAAAKWLTGPGPGHLMREIPNDGLPYDFSATGTALGLLIETANHNRLGTSWNIGTGGVTGLTAVAGDDPAGGNTGIVWSEDTALNWHGVNFGSVACPANTSEILSYFVKKTGNVRYFYVRGSHHAEATRYVCIFDLDNMNVDHGVTDMWVHSGAGNFVNQNFEPGSQAVGNGWYRVWVKTPVLTIARTLNASAGPSNRPTVLGAPQPESGEPTQNAAIRFTGRGSTYNVGVAWAMLQYDEPAIGSFTRGINRPADVVTITVPSGHHPVVVSAPSGMTLTQLQGGTATGHLRELRVVEDA